MEGVFGRRAGWRKPFSVHQEMDKDSKRAARPVLTRCDSQVYECISPNMQSPSG